VYGLVPLGVIFFSFAAGCAIKGIFSLIMGELPDVHCRSVCRGQVLWLPRGHMNNQARRHKHCCSSTTITAGSCFSSTSMGHATLGNIVSPNQACVG
jgi:hypothetical protein